MFLVIWFLTDFKIHFINTIFRRDLDNSNINEYINLHFNHRILWTDFTIAGLISCPFCLGVWLSIPSIFIFGWQIFPVFYIAQMLLFGLVKKLN